MSEPFDIHRPPVRIRTSLKSPDDIENISTTDHDEGQVAEAAEVSHIVDMPTCPVCGGGLISIRAKSQCERCHRIVETCCEGGPE